MAAAPDLLLATLLSLTDERRATVERELVATARAAALGELAADIGHDLANSLFAVLGLVDLLVEDAVPGSPMEERLELIQQTGLELRAGLGRLLDFARADAAPGERAALDGAARAAVALLRHGEAKQPRVALVDVRMPRLSGIELAKRAAVVAPNTSIVFYTAYGDRALLSEALDVGARGFVLKEAPLPDLVRAVERVAAGEAYVDPVLAGVLVSAQTDKVPSLTQREREVLRELADGHSNEEIGKRLFISPETVRTHVRKAMAKLEADTRTQAVAKALRQSLIS